MTSTSRSGTSSAVSGSETGSDVTGSEASTSDVSGSEVSGSETGSSVTGSDVSSSAVSSGMSSSAVSSGMSSSAVSSGMSSSAVSSSAVSSSAVSSSAVSGSSAASGSEVTESGTSALSGSSAVSGTSRSGTSRSGTSGISGASTTGASTTGASGTSGVSASRTASAVSGRPAPAPEPVKGKPREAERQPDRGEEVFSTRIDTFPLLNQKEIAKGGAGMSHKEEEKLVQKAKEREKETIPEAKGPKTGRRLYIMRHAERMDRIFPGWTRLAFTDLGKYRPYDLNQSLTLPKRSGGPAHFHNDTPITEMGYVASQMIGRGMRLNRVNVSAIYSSPALRCVQTAFGLMKTLNAPCKIRVEPGLFEWLAWYESPPVWMSPEELNVAGYPVETDYKPFLEVGTLFKMYLKETSMEHYERFGKVLADILERNPEKGAILVIGHGTSLDGARKILGRQIDPLSRAEMDRMGLHYPYCSVVAMEELANKAWRVIHNPIPSITYLDFSNRLNFQFFNR